MLLPNISEAPINLTVVIPNDLWYSYYDNTASNATGSILFTNIYQKTQTHRLQKKKKKTSEKSAIIHEYPIRECPKTSGWLVHVNSPHHEPQSY